MFGVKTGISNFFELDKLIFHHQFHRSLCRLKNISLVSEYESKGFRPCRFVSRSSMSRDIVERGMKTCLQEGSVL